MKQECTDQNTTKLDSIASKKKIINVKSFLSKKNAGKKRRKV